ncbi:FkbM family methyltransferase [Thermocoleostomius sinensis]|uniref:FkbM family methyltransferase n=1 Tax=Thermocoleostomius sinensis A174 TaxID=2016057 RepID=A0A9E9CAI2_9CYAN|nr:FkbM family methyltransferase [Thermocoleostomius sinensis]WAL58970.1 FkbM family methyltransferase [Thermocoleostomius sinensis A174]
MSVTSSGAISALLTGHLVPPRVLIIDMTRIGDYSATGQMKQSIFGLHPAECLLQVYMVGERQFGLYSPASDSAIKQYQDCDQLLADCIQFAPDVIYYRPVAERPLLHTFAVAAIAKLSIPTVIHIVDDWPERLRLQTPSRYVQLDQSLRRLLNDAFACLSICEAMSIAYRERYGVDFIAIANCIKPEDWLPTNTQISKKFSRVQPFTIRYVGSLADDMTCQSILDVAEVIAALQTEYSINFEIYTTNYWKQKAINTFSNLPGVSIHEAAFSTVAYRQLLITADALLIAYNFDPDSVTYVRYSMANKFPECLASGNPVLVYGPIDVAPIAYAAEIGCTQLVIDRDPNKLKIAICALIDDPNYARALGQAAREYAFQHHSESVVAKRFYEILCQAAQSALPTRHQSVSNLVSSDQQSILGPFTRDQSVCLDETQLVAELLSHLPEHSIMLDVGAHHGSALLSFVEKGWRVFAYEPDPDNRQVLERRMNSYTNLTIDRRAVSDRAGETVSFYASPESTGISTLSPFQDSHQQKCQVITTTVAEICAEHQLHQIDFLKIDTEGHDLMVLKGVPWDKIHPAVIECEFEDHKTVPLGYTVEDLAQYLVDRGYTVLVSEWHPIVRYGIQHDWHRLMLYPCQLATPHAWGNLLAFKHTPDLEQVVALTQKLIKTKSEKPITQISLKLSNQATIEGHNGMNPSRLQDNPQQDSTESLNGKHSSHSELSRQQEPFNPPKSVPVLLKLNGTRLATGLLGRVGRYYSRWPLSIALLAIGLNTIAMLDDVPFRWIFSSGGTFLLVFLVGHAASKADVALQTGERAQETVTQSQEMTARLQKKATSAFKRATQAGERLKLTTERVDQAIAEAVTVADRAISTAKFATEMASRATGSAQSGAQSANRAIEMATASLETAKNCHEIAQRSLSYAESASAQTTQAIADLKQQIDQMSILNPSNTSNIKLFQPFGRQLSQEHIEVFTSFWTSMLRLQLNQQGLGYLAHRICLSEDICTGRLATTVQDMALRVLVAQSLRTPNLSVLEIGSLFGINLAIIYETCRDHFEQIHLSAIDPLDGYYDKGRTDVITQVPVTRKIFEHNMRQMDIAPQDITLLQGLSTESVILEKAGLRQYNLLIIDGDHSYAGVKFDFDHYLAAVDVGGYIIFDDYNSEDWPEVTEFVDNEVKRNSSVEFIGSSWRTAVFKVIRKNLV